jgi:hypothetical protein
MELFGADKDPNTLSLAQNYAIGPPFSPWTRNIIILWQDEH